MPVPSSLKATLETLTVPAAPPLVRAEAEGAIRCLACGHRCLVRPGRSGVCKVRANRDGVLQVPGGYVAGLQRDPIEKKPFFHAYPGHDALSFGMLGCDLHCGYCQNWITSQALRDDAAVSAPQPCTADAVVRIARDHHAPVLVSTYNEPLITADWSMQIFEKAKAAGFVCGFVSNGNATPEVLEFIRPCVDLYKVDLKSFRDANYRQLGCTLATVLDTIGRLKDMGFWVEIVTLVVPGFNDTADELRGIAQFLAGVSVDIPWHVTAFHPDYKMTDRNPTSVATLQHAYALGREAGLNYVYPGNIPGHAGNRESTWCPSCDRLLIRREGFRVLENRMERDICPGCATHIPGVWEANPPQRSRGTGTPIPVEL